MKIPKKKKIKKKKKKKEILLEKSQNLVECESCGYKITKPFPEDHFCPNCKKFLVELHDLATEQSEKIQPKEFETQTSTPSSKLEGKVKVKEKQPPKKISWDNLSKGEYVKLLGITSIDRTELYCSNQTYIFLLELTNNLDFIATGILGGKLDKMLLVSEENKTKEKCQFYVKDEIIYLIYGKFPDKKGKWLLEQMSNNFSELVKGKDVNNLNKFEKYQIELEFEKRTNFILKEYLKLQEIFSDQEIPYVEDSIRIDYLGLSSMSIGVISLLIGEDLNIELQMEVDTAEEKEMKESMLTARIEAIAANTQGNTGAIPRWIAVKLGFQKYRFLTFKKYMNDYYLSLLSEGNLGKITNIEELIDLEVENEVKTPFSGNLQPFNKLKKRLENLFSKRWKFPPFNFTREEEEEEKKETDLEKVKEKDSQSNL